MKRNQWLVCLMLACVLGLVCMPTLGWADEMLMEDDEPQAQVAQTEDEMFVEDDEKDAGPINADGSASAAPSGAAAADATAATSAAAAASAAASTAAADEATMEADNTAVSAPDQPATPAAAGATDAPASTPATSSATPEPATLSAEAEAEDKQTSSPKIDLSTLDTTDVRLDQESTSGFPVSEFLRTSNITSATVAYHTHMQYYGWGDYAINAHTAGNPRKGMRMEGIEIGVKVPGIRGGIRYRVCMQTYGWKQDWRQNGQMAGSVGKSKRIEAIRIELTGDLAKKYNVWYRTYIESKGWGGWTLNGKESGLAGKGKRVEAVQIKLLPKGTSTVRRQEGKLVNYNVRMQTYGWMATVADGKKAGTAPQGNRLEAINIRLGKQLDGGIRYRSYVQDAGWEDDWRADGQTSGTVGQQKRIEAIAIELTGAVAKKYNVWYRTYTESKGWGSWKLNGRESGLPGKGKRIESIQIKLMRKGTATVKALANKKVNYNVRVQNYGWMTTVADGKKAGAAPEALRLEAVNICLGNMIGGGIRYRSHVQGDGWQSGWKYNGETSGTVGENKCMEAIRIQLTGSAKDEYNVWYRVYAKGKGWLGWTYNGLTAGKTGEGMQLEAIQIQVIRQGEAGPDGSYVPTGGSFVPGSSSSLIYLDAGHGMSGESGWDSGAIGSGYIEATETAELVNKVAEYATTIYGLNVYNNVGCDVHYRYRQAHAAEVGATSFVSIHFNWASSGATGTETFIYRTYSYYLGKAAAGSSTLQKIIHRRVVGALGLYDRGMKSEAFAVLNGYNTNIPATLVEICFISNAGDMERYKAREDKVARALAAGLYEIYQAGY